MSATSKPIGIVVVGPFRSGTSLIARVLSLLGVDFGPIRELFEPSAFNPAGYFQRPDVTAINTALILSAATSLEHPPDPALLARTGDLAILRRVSLAWTDKAPLWGIKDPRFCCTLYSWIRAGILSETETRIVRIKRSFESAARSAVQHYDVKEFCGADLARAREMLKAYDALAAWHVRQLRVPAIEVSYELLAGEPRSIVGKLADFLAVADSARIESAIATVGTGRSPIESESEQPGSQPMILNPLQNPEG